MNGKTKGLCEKVIITAEPLYDWHHQLGNRAYNDYSQQFVNITERFTDSLGDEYLILTRSHGRPWYSSKSKSGFDPAGDPRWAAWTLGTHLSQYWGFI